MSSSKINTFHVLENVPISPAICRISSLIVHLRTSAMVIEHTAIEPNDLGGTATVLCRKAQSVCFPLAQGMSDSPLARSDSTFTSSIEGKATNGYPSRTVFRSRNLATTQHSKTSLM